MFMKALRTTLLAAVSLTFIGVSGAAASGDAAVSALKPVDAEVLAPVRFQKASLLVAGDTGSARYSPATLEQFGVYRLVTHSPWRDAPAAFEGVRLVDILAAHGLVDAKAIRVSAENDYAVVIPRSVWRDHAVLVATRVDGRAHSRRQRGPIQFVFDYDDDAATRDKSFEQNWVWMAARIEAVD